MSFNYYLPRISGWVFVLLFIAISYAYQFHEILFYRPQGVHQWRQADCLSITANYYHDGMDFFDPAIHNQMCDGNTSGRTAAEFPVLYYGVALIWKITGQHEWIYRLVNLLITFLGLFALFRTLEELLKDSLWAIGGSLLFYTSPMFAYYSNNFLTNAPAFAFVLIAWYFFFLFYKSEKPKWFHVSILFFLLAALLKITAAISFIVLFVIFLIEWLGIYRFKDGRRLFERPIKQSIAFAVAFAALGGWYWYAHNYNEDHGCAYSFLHVWPIWKMDSALIDKTLEAVELIWIHEYFNPDILKYAAYILPVILLLWKRMNKFLLLAVIGCFIGVTAYVLMWFNAVESHDYYLINLLILFVFMLIAALHYLRIYHFKIFNSIILKVVFFFFLEHNVSLCAERMHWRYAGWMNEHHNTYFKALETITPYNRSLGITRDDKVISIPDHSINISLYLMDQKGWPTFGSDFADSTDIADKIALGAKYLLINDPALYQEDYIRPFTGKKIGSYRNVDIYDLTP